MANKIAVGLVLVALIVYAGVEAYPLLKGPSLTIESPINGESVPKGVVTVRGTAIRTATLTLNGHPLLTDEMGVFLSTFAFPRGTTILTFVAKDRFGRSITTTRSMFVPN